MKAILRILLFLLILCDSSYSGVIEQKYFRGVSAMMDLRYNHALMQSKNVSPEDKIKVARDTYDITLNFRSQERAINGNDKAIEYGDRAMDDDERANGADAFIVLTMQTATNVLNANIDNFDIDYEIKKYSRGDFNEAQQEHFDICREVANQTLGINTGSQDEEMVAEWLADKAFKHNGSLYFERRRYKDQMEYKNLEKLSGDSPEVLHKVALGSLLSTCKPDYLSHDIENYSEADLYEVYSRYEALNNKHMQRLGLPAQLSASVEKVILKKMEFYKKHWGKKLVDMIFYPHKKREYYIYSLNIGQVIGKLLLEETSNTTTRLSNITLFDEFKPRDDSMGFDGIIYQKSNFESGIKHSLEVLGKLAEVTKQQTAFAKLKEIGQTIVKKQYEYKKKTISVEKYDGFKEDLENYYAALKEFADEIGGSQVIYGLLDKAYRKYNKLIESQKPSNSPESREAYDVFINLLQAVVNVYIFELSKEDSSKMTLPTWHDDLMSIIQQVKEKDGLVGQVYNQLKFLHLDQIAASYFLKKYSENANKMDLVYEPEKSELFNKMEQYLTGFMQVAKYDNNLYLNYLDTYTEDSLENTREDLKVAANPVATKSIKKTIQDVLNVIVRLKLLNKSQVYNRRVKCR